MAFFSFDNSNSGSGGPFNIFRGEGDAQGNPVYESRTFEDYTVPPAGTYVLALSGFAEPEEVDIPEQFRRDNGPTTRLETKLELEIQDGPGKGHRFIISYVTFSLGDRSNAFKLYVATVCDGKKADVPMQRDWDSMLGKSFQAYITNPRLKDDGTPLRAGISWDTISPVRENAAGAAYDPFTRKAS